VFSILYLVFGIWFLQNPKSAIDSFHLAPLLFFLKPQTSNLMLFILALNPEPLNREPWKTLYLK
jgi:hypothetical protein